MFSTILIRFFDIILSLIFILFCSPIFFIVYLLIVIMDGYPILYISERVGKNGILFKFFKFRTMKTKESLNEQDTITFIGKYLRRLSIDELPQLYNVLINDMSIVGPRPLPIDIEKQISKENLIIRRSIKPGITGYSQILYNKKKRSWDEKIKDDLIMIKKYNFKSYLFIILLTFPVLIKRFKFNSKGDTL